MEYLEPLPEHLAPQWLSPSRQVPAFLRRGRKRLSQEQVTEIARALADQGEALPSAVAVGARRLSLCDAFQALAFGLEHYAIRKSLADEITIAINEIYEVIVVRNALLQIPGVLHMTEPHSTMGFEKLLPCC